MSADREICEYKMHLSQSSMTSILVTKKLFTGLTLRPVENEDGTDVIKNTTGI